MLFLTKTPYLLKKFYPKALIWHKTRAKKIIYLTFDDGPIPIVTPWVIKTLKNFNAKATFFCIGDNIIKHPEIFEQLKADGHSIGNHTFNHLKGWNTDDETYIANVLKCQKLTQTNLFRPPYGRIKKSQIEKIFEMKELRIQELRAKNEDDLQSSPILSENQEPKAKSKDDLEGSHISAENQEQRAKSKDDLQSSQISAENQEQRAKSKDDLQSSPILSENHEQGAKSKDNLQSSHISAENQEQRAKSKDDLQSSHISAENQEQRAKSKDDLQSSQISAENQEQRAKSKEDLQSSQISNLKSHISIVMWDVLSGDFDPSLSGEKCLRNVLKHTENGSIVVFHDSLKAWDRLEFVLPKALKVWKDEGFVFGVL